MGIAFRRRCPKCGRHARLWRVWRAGGTLMGLYVCPAGHSFTAKAKREVRAYKREENTGASVGA